MLIMFKTVKAAVLIVLFPCTALAQPAEKPVKFKDFVFESVAIQKDLQYTSGSGDNQYNLFDFYEAAGDSSANRPLIIWLHGGGFKFGTKKSGGLPLWSKTFARRGYACASINYQLSKKHPLKYFPDMVQGCADAIEDVNTAIRYFKLHCKQFRIDSTRIILGGNSAGGMIALQSVYSSQADMARLIHTGDSTSAAAHMHNPEQVAGVINFWGALLDMAWLNNARVPIVSVHGKKDRVVSWNDGKPGMYGSMAIHRVADSLQIPNQLRIYDDYAHELQKHFNPLFAGPGAKKRWAEAGDFAASFLYEQLFRIK